MEARREVELGSLAVVEDLDLDLHLLRRLEGVPAVPLELIDRGSVIRLLLAASVREEVSEDA